MKRILSAGVLALSAVLMAPICWGQTTGTSPFTTIVDRNGKKLTDKDLPPGVSAFAALQMQGWVAHYPPASPAGFVTVAGAPVSPEGKRDLDFGSHLFGNHWAGFTKQEKVGDIVVAVETMTVGPASPDVLTYSGRFKVQRLDCVTINVPLPVPLAPGTLVWLGDVKLKPDTSPTIKVTGRVIDDAKKALDLTGTAYLYVWDTPMTEGLSAPIKNGQYTFPAVHPNNDYLLQGQAAGYDIKPSFTRLKADGTAPALEMVATMVPTSSADVAAVTSPHDGIWLTSYSEARQASLASKKPIFMDFTGSDWCGWCILFDKDVLSKPEFEAYAKDHLVLLRLDFPNAKPLPAEQKRQNAQLQLLENVQAFPTYVLMSGDGKELFRQSSYSKGGPAPFIAKLEKAAGNTKN